MNTSVVLSSLMDRDVMEDGGTTKTVLISDTLAGVSDTVDTLAGVSDTVEGFGGCRVIVTTALHGTHKSQAASTVWRSVGPRSTAMQHVLRTDRRCCHRTRRSCQLSRSRSTLLRVGGA